MSQNEISENEETSFQQKWKAAVDIEDARRRSHEHIDKLFHKKEAALKANETTAFQKECEQGYTAEESKEYILNHLRSIWKK